jgi:hypothetical protein
VPGRVLGLHNPFSEEPLPEPSPTVAGHPLGALEMVQNGPRAPIGRVALSNSGPVRSTARGEPRSPSPPALLGKGFSNAAQCHFVGPHPFSGRSCANSATARCPRKRNQGGPSAFGPSQLYTAHHGTCHEIGREPNWWRSEAGDLYILGLPMFTTRDADGQRKNEHT